MLSTPQAPHKSCIFHTHTYTHTELEETREMKFLQPLYYQERHTQRRKAANLFILKKNLWQKSVKKSPVKTYMVKQAFWKISKKKTKSRHF
jgi:hypothetical protein